MAKYEWLWHRLDLTGLESARQEIMPDRVTDRFVLVVQNDIHGVYYAY